MSCDVETLDDSRKRYELEANERENEERHNKKNIVAKTA